MSPPTISEQNSNPIPSACYTYMFVWKANYSDGTFLKQVNEDGTENHYQDIDRSKLSSFELFDGERRVYVLFLHKGQRLIFRRRVTIDLFGQPRDIHYLVGYQYTDGDGSNKSVVNYVHEDGFVELDDERKDIVILPQESL